MKKFKPSKFNKSEGKVWWSSLKKEIECRFNPILRKRVNVHRARYRGSHYECQFDDGAGAVWITVDKKEIFRAAHFTFIKHLKEYIKDLCQELGVTEEYCFSDPKIMSKAFEQLAEVGIMGDEACLDLMVGFGNIKIDNAINSKCFVLKLLAVFDERTTTEQLDILEKCEKDDTLLLKMITLRRDANNVSK